MKRLFLYIIVVTLCLTHFSSKNTDAAIMEDYCQVPPYVIQNVAPNVMIVLDNSGSMFRFAYSDGFNTTATGDDNSCADSGSPCTGFTNPGAYPVYKYYGYFDPDYWYTYASNRFTPQDPKTGSGITGERAKNADEWDGSFLNWVTMRRTDIIRKVMTGGRISSNRLAGIKADCDGRGRFKQITNAENYIDNSYTGTRCLRVLTNAGSCGGGGSGTAEFEVSSDASCTSSFSTGYNVSVVVPIPVEGVLQRVVGARARMGLSFYHVNAPTPQGGFVQVNISGGSLSSTVNQINLKRPNSNTPLAETLWAMTGYFAQEASLENGPGPQYSGGDYQINDNVDPYNYGGGGPNTRYPQCAKSFILYITDGEPCADGNLPETIKDYANGRSIYDCYDEIPGDPTDRSETGDPGSRGYCPGVTATAPETYNFPASNFPSCSGGGQGGYVAGFEDVALYMHTTDLRNAGGSPDVGVNNISGMQNLTLFTVFAFGGGSTLLKYASINGGFEDSDGSNTPNLQSEWDQDDDGEPDNYYEATDGDELEQAIEDAFLSILKRASSGTAASVLASGEGTGANLLQAVFYPRRRFDNKIISWTGMLQNLWYYIDPYFISSGIYEDTTDPYVFDLTNDNMVELYFDTAAGRVMADLYSDSDNDGIPDSGPVTINFEDLNSLWEAGNLLWSRDLAANPRTIYTTIDGTNLLAGNFSTGNAATLAPYLQAVDINGINGNTDEAEYIIRYTHGEGLTTEDLDNDGLPDVAGIDLDGDGEDDYRTRTVRQGAETRVWKLGDILNSTPTISSWVQLNAYDTRYYDDTYTDYLNTPGYTERGMAFVGSNSGMLHALKLGKMEVEWDGQTEFEKARMINNLNPATPLGYEMWTFIPKHVLPYLKYMMEPDYCHVYTVDLSSYLFDASINNPVACGAGDYWNCDKDVSSWRTILIGGMNRGGACKSSTTACTEDMDKDGDTDSEDCVNTPGVDLNGDGDTLDAGEDAVGYSSYFALDITDTLADPTRAPELLWEFSNEDIPPAELLTGGLGFATTHPSIVRISAREDPANSSSAPVRTKNGRWYVVFGSGPTGPIETTELQFMGRSDQPLKLFVLDLKGPSSGSWTLNTDYWIKDTGIPYAFAGSLLNSANDFDKDYQVDAVYAGYTNRIGQGNNPDPYRWHGGGIGRLLTKEDLNPANWVWSTVIEEIGPVTSSVAEIRNTTKKQVWLYFGTGRYYFSRDEEKDDPDGQRQIFGIKEPCYTFAGGLDTACTTALSFCDTPLTSNPCGALTNVTDINDVPTDPLVIAAMNGWYINLDSAGSYTYDGVPRDFGAERAVTDPSASVLGVAFFTTYKPYIDECALGGKTFVWATDAETGGTPSALKGTILLQLSTGSIEELELSDVFTEADGRKSEDFEGEPPGPGPVIQTSPPPVKRIIHMRER